LSKGCDRQGFKFSAEGGVWFLLSAFIGPMVRPGPIM
jgi:hypothetical protein